MHVRAFEHACMHACIHTCIRACVRRPCASARPRAVGEMPQTVVGDVLVLSRTVDALVLCCGDLVPLLREMALLAEMPLLGEMPGEMSHTRLALMTGSVPCVFGFRVSEGSGFRVRLALMTGSVPGTYTLPCYV